MPPRMQLDLYTDDQAGEVKRLIALGATEVQWSKRPPDADYVILADPEGNRISRCGHNPLAASRLVLASCPASMQP